MQVELDISLKSFPYNQQTEG